ncbi:hypothetical protein L596_030367 [Steinernema carpocapsae]|uniref:3'-5' exonuclease domain-containing protein n=1 Tax=Steinernema carpocapsae TaxID=34508 RepID=A0A4U5LP86_STECR|nr:hypothetical protein L596_030367 [Steinernema carpocapsae]
MTCLIQISTRSHDYVIDALALWDHCHLLKKPFADINIVKVFHSAFYDVKWLFRDFGIEVQNLFDTQIAMRPFGHARISLKNLAKIYGEDLDKSLQAADWSERPLSKDMIEYAAKDSSVLLGIADQIRNNLKIGSPPNYFPWLLKECTDVARDYRLPAILKPEETGFTDQEWDRWNEDQQNMAKKLYDERDKLAREVDMNPEVAFPLSYIVYLVDWVNTRFRFQLNAFCLDSSETEYLISSHKNVYGKVVPTKAWHMPCSYSYQGKKLVVVEGVEMIFYATPLEEKIPEIEDEGYDEEYDSSDVEKGGCFGFC